MVRWARCALCSECWINIRFRTAADRIPCRILCRMETMKHDRDSGYPGTSTGTGTVPYECTMYTLSLERVPTASRSTGRGPVYTGTSTVDLFQVPYSPHDSPESTEYPRYWYAVRVGQYHQYEYRTAAPTVRREVRRAGLARHHCRSLCAGRGRALLPPHAGAIE